MAGSDIIVNIDTVSDICLCPSKPAITRIPRLLSADHRPVFVHKYMYRQYSILYMYTVFDSSTYSARFLEH